jgi:hypothetical protein
MSLIGYKIYILKSIITAYIEQTHGGSMKLSASSVILQDCISLKRTLDGYANSEFFSNRNILIGFIFNSVIIKT